MCICICICICLCFCIFGGLHFLFFVRFFLLRPLSNCILNQLSNHVAVGWQTHLFSLKPAQTNTHTQHWHSLWLHYSVFPTHSLIPPNSLSPPHSIFLSLSLSSASPSASQVLILLSFHTIFQHRLPPLSLSSLALFTSAVKLSAASEIVIIQCLLGSFPTNFNVWKLSLNFEWQWGRVSERERGRRGKGGELERAAPTN